MNSPQSAAAHAATDYPPNATPSRPLPAWAISLVLHGLVFAGLTYTLQLTPPGAALDPDRKVAIVLVHEKPGEREYFDGQADQGQAANAHEASTQSALPAPQEVPVNVAGVLPEPQEISGNGLANALPQASEFTAGGRPRGGPDNGTSTEVFGITGVGSKFVYVFDRSGSMDGYQGRPLLAAKRELLRSLQDLDAIHQFQIIFYNEQPQIFTPQPGTPQLVYGNEQGKKAASDFVAGIVANGGTRHLEALQLALKMRPDVIFFLTDADEPQLTAAELARIQRWNYGTTIHAIEFAFGPQSSADNFLIRLARQNGGQHAYVDLSRLPSE